MRASSCGASVATAMQHQLNGTSSLRPFRSTLPHSQMTCAGLAGQNGAVPDLAAADDNFAGVLGLADSLLASRTAPVRALARTLYAALFRLHNDAAQRERLLRDLVWRAAARPQPPSGAQHSLDPFSL